MNSDGIKTFIMLSKLKNFTRTAERMYVAQSTVTNRIAELESETGQKLFVRRQGGVELTEEGQLFLSYAVRINDLEESFIREANSAARYDRQLRVGAINAVYESSLYPPIEPFFQRTYGRIAQSGARAFDRPVTDAAGQHHRRGVLLSSAQKGGLCEQEVFVGQTGAARIPRGQRL